MAFLFARQAGIFVATSNGNSGPGLGTTGTPAGNPWVTSVGAGEDDGIDRAVGAGPAEGEDQPLHHVGRIGIKLALVVDGDPDIVDPLGRSAIGRQHGTMLVANLLELEAIDQVVASSGVTANSAVKRGGSDGL